MAEVEMESNPFASGRGVVAAATASSGVGVDRTGTRPFPYPSPQGSWYTTPVWHGDEGTAGTETFLAEEAAAWYQPTEGRCYLARKPDASGVSFNHLPPGERAVFQGSRDTEVQALIDLGAFRVMTEKESAEFRRQRPERVLPTQWVDRWKPQDDGSRKAKSRLVVLGWKDPDILQVERSAPTPTLDNTWPACGGTAGHVT